MTVVYYVGGKLVGLSSDIKPTSVPTHSTFIESDTFKEFIFDGVATWNELFGFAGGVFNVGEMTGSHAQNAEGGFIGYTIQDWGETRTITNVRFQGTSVYSGPKNSTAQWRLNDAGSTTVASQTIPNTGNQPFDTGNVAVASLDATSVQLFIFQEGEGGAPVITVTSDDNALTAA